MTTVRALKALRIIVPTRCRALSKNQKYMPEVVFDETLKEEAIYKAHLERLNAERAELAKRSLRRRRISLWSCFGVAFLIYVYTIARIKQEVFLDDFNEPERIPKEES